jgi:hypothetical protein
MMPLALFLVGGLVLTGCFEDNMVTYDGPPQVEFKPTTATITGTSGATFNMPVQLIGPHQASDVTLQVEVVAEATTATGTNYTIPSSVTIPAGSSFGSIPVTVGTVTAPVTLTVQLMDNEEAGVFAADNYDTFALSMAPPA